MTRLSLLAIALLALPSAQAALQLSVEDEPLGLPPGTTTDLEVTGTISCQDFITAGKQTLTVTLSSDAPDEWGPADGTLTFTAGADCLSASTSTTATGKVSFTPTADAMGLIGETITIAATGDLEDTVQRNELMWVAYQPGHTMETSIDFPYELTESKLTFNLTITITANTNTMVMFENVTTTGGNVAGLSHEQFFFTAGEERTRTKTISWEPPTGEWEEATISFYNYSHCLIFDFGDCDAEVEDNISWTITNGGVPSPEPEGDGDKGSPGAGILLVLAAVGAALVLRRR